MTFSKSPIFGGHSKAATLIRSQCEIVHKQHMPM